MKPAFEANSLRLRSSSSLHTPSQTHYVSVKYEDLHGMDNKQISHHACLICFYGVMNYLQKGKKKPLLCFHGFEPQGIMTLAEWLKCVHLSKNKIALIQSQTFWEEQKIKHHEPLQNSYHMSTVLNCLHSHKPPKSSVFWLFPFTKKTRYKKCE